MRQRESYKDNIVLLEQQHQELQLDAMKILYRKRLIEFKELKTPRDESMNRFEMLCRAVEGKSLTISALQQQLNRISELLNSADSQTSYDKDFQLRQQYYVESSKGIDPKTVFPELSSLKCEGFKSIVVSPEGLKFNRERHNTLLSGLADAGFLCFSFNLEIKENIQCLAEGYYEYKDEVSLLIWLTKQEVKPIVLCTWVFQYAWVDLLKIKTIWYDICEHEDKLWGADAQSRLKHFDLLKQASLVTYSERPWKRYVASRHDAFLLTPVQVGILGSTLLNSLEVCN